MMVISLRRRLAEPRDAAGLGAFRALFGALMLLAVIRFVAKGWVGELYLEPRFHFSYLGFEWVRPWPAPAMYAHFALMALAALSLMLGYRTRLSALVFFVTFTYAELLEKSAYLNHYYLVSLLSLLLVFVPAGGALAIDARRSPRVATVLSYSLLRIQVGVVWAFAGLAKLDGDWLLGAEPLRTWLQAHQHVPWLGAALAHPTSAVCMSLAGAAFDLGIVPLLCSRRTRALGYAIAAVFHGCIWLLFPVGVFSWVMLVAATVFFEPNWPRRVLGLAGEMIAMRPAARQSVGVVAAAAVYVLVQVLVPLRFLFYPGATNWTEEGFRFSWRVMLTEKTGSVEFDVCRDGQQPCRLVLPHEELTPLQVAQMSTQPDMIHEYALHLARRFERAGAGPVRVHARAFAALNGRPSQYLVDPSVDLATQRRSLRPKAWIVPLGAQPLRVSTR